MKKINLLITGGAGFIGSNPVEHFLKDDRVALVCVLDDLSNGYYSLAYSSCNAAAAANAAILLV